MAQDNFYLDTKNMDAVYEKIVKIAETMQTLKEDYRRAVTDLTVHWDGESRNMFDKKSAQLLRTMTDISQSFFDIGEDLQSASQAYMDVDVKNAKALKGNQNRF